MKNIRYIAVFLMMLALGAGNAKAWVAELNATNHYLLAYDDNYWASSGTWGGEVLASFYKLTPYAYCSPVPRVFVTDEEPLDQIGEFVAPKAGLVEGTLAYMIPIFYQDTQRQAANQWQYEGRYHLVDRNGSWGPWVNIGSAYGGVTYDSSYKWFVNGGFAGLQIEVDGTSYVNNYKIGEELVTATRIVGNSAGALYMNSQSVLHLEYIVPYSEGSYANIRANLQLTFGTQGQESVVFVPLASPAIGYGDPASIVINGNNYRVASQSISFTDIYAGFLGVSPSSLLSPILAKGLTKIKLVIYAQYNIFRTPPTSTEGWRLCLQQLSIETPLHVLGN